MMLSTFESPLKCKLIYRSARIYEMQPFADGEAATPCGQGPARRKAANRIAAVKPHGTAHAALVRSPILVYFEILAPKVVYSDT